MTIEEISYDFTEYTEHFRNFFSKILKLIIISKLNCQESNKTSFKYFSEIVSKIDDCESHKVKYGKSMMFTKYLQYEFTYQTIKVTIKITNKYVIDILFESIIPDFVKFFDELSSDTKSIKWNATSADNKGFQEDIIMKEEKSNIDSIKKNQKSEDNDRNNEIQNEIKIIFYLLELFIDTLYYLTSLSPDTNTDSLIGKMIEIKDVSVNRKNLNIEILIDEKTIIIILSPNKNNPISIVLDNENKTGNTIKELILQNKNF
ncbi:MAG: hypothetical protein H0X03_03325 [Nitrosopumilus sp.]|nr:hypothetical protein [Nitrosopumilus sp.]